MKIGGNYFNTRKGRLVILLAGLVLALGLAWIGSQYVHINLGFKDVIGIMHEKLDLIANIRTNLLKSVHLESGAVMAGSEEAARALADQSRQAADAVNRDHKALGLLVQKDHTEREMELLREFDACWSVSRKIDQELLQLAVENTNIKAANLSFVQGSLAITRFEGALADLKGSEPLDRKDYQIAQLACNALAAGLKIHYLQAPHIAAANEEQMNNIEADIKRQEDVITASLRKLKSLLLKQEGASWQDAEAAYGELKRVTAEVIDLSRQNSNIKSFELSLGRKHKVTAECDEILTRLQHAVRRRGFTGTR
jgi:hypothetical protein